MLTRDEAERLAQAVNAFRPDWPISSLITFLRKDDRWKRPYRALALELVYVALDPASKTPARIDEKGPWKNLHGTTETSASSHIRQPEPDDCDVCNQPAASAHLDHEYTPRGTNGYGTPLTPELRESITEQMAATKLDLSAAVCAECGQPPARHSAPAYADHPFTAETQEDES